MGGTKGFGLIRIRPMFILKLHQIKKETILQQNIQAKPVWFVKSCEWICPLSFYKEKWQTYPSFQKQNLPFFEAWDTDQPLHPNLP